MSLAAAGLAIGEDGSIITLKYILDERVGSFGIDVALQTVIREYMIVGETLQILRLVGFEDGDLVDGLVGTHNRFALQSLLLGVDRPNSNYHFYGLTHDRLAGRRVNLKQYKGSSQIEP